MISTLLKLPVFKRLIPSILIRASKLLKKNRGYFKIKEVEMFLDFLDPIDRQIILFREYENKEINLLSELIKQNSITDFVDVGANCGYYSFFVSKDNPNVKVFSYEPNSEAYTKLQKTLQKNISFIHKINIYNFGLSDSKSKKTLRSLTKFGYAQTGGASVEANYGHEQEADFEIGDNVLHFDNKNLALKIDVEGHEINVLKGLKNTLIKNNCVIQIEIFDDNWDRINNYLESLNYNLISQFKDRSNYFYSKNS